MFAGFVRASYSHAFSQRDPAHFVCWFCAVGPVKAKTVVKADMHQRPLHFSHGVIPARGGCSKQAMNASNIRTLCLVTCQNLLHAMPCHVKPFVWHGMAWHGMAWHGMAWHGMLVVLAASGAGLSCDDCRLTVRQSRAEFCCFVELNPVWLTRSGWNRINA
jgi:hypothetical protein